MRESEERYRRLVELSSDAVIVHSNGRFLYVNPAGVKLLGATSSDELVGRRVRDFGHPDYRELIKARMVGVQERRKQAGLIEEKIVKLDGKVVDVEATSIPLRLLGEST